MVLIGFSLGRVMLGVLCVSLALLVFIIAYKKLLAYLGKGSPVSRDYCVLYSLEQDPAHGEIEIYFTSESKKKVVLRLLNDQGMELAIIKAGEIDEGGHIVRLDTKQFDNGLYSYQLITENQKTTKRFMIENK